MLNDHQIHKCNEGWEQGEGGAKPSDLGREPGASHRPRAAPGGTGSSPSSHDGHRDSEFAFEQGNKIFFFFIIFFFPYQ